MRHSHAAGRFTAVGVLITGLLATAAPAMAAPNAAATPGGSAYGLTVTGPLSVPPMPAVASYGTEVNKHLARLDQTKLVNASVLDVSAAGNRARASVARASVPALRLMASAVTAECVNGQGSAHLARAVLAGRRLDSTPAPNTTIPVDVEGVGRVAVTLNKQERLADGRLNVTALEVQAQLLGQAATVRVSSAACGAPEAKPHKPAEPAKPQAPVEAPAPRPVKHDLPVTG